MSVERCVLCVPAIFCVVVLAGCSRNAGQTSLSSSAQTEPAPHAIRRLPQPGEIAEFRADPIPSRTDFEDFTLDRSQIEDILRTWHQVSQDHWRHGYSHVCFDEDRTGTVKLKDGSLMDWMVKPGGLATFTLPDGTVVYLASELTPWRKGANQ